jgi:hypothetical protein
MPELISADQLCVSILQAENVVWTLCVPFDADRFINRGSFQYDRGGVHVRLDNLWGLLNAYAGKFRLTLNKADLTCLCSPITLAVALGGFAESAVADEELNPGLINGKQLLPIKFLAGCTDAFRIDKLLIKPGSVSKGDFASLKGVVVCKDAPPDLTIEDVSVGWGSASFTIPAGAFQRVGKNQPKYRCKKFRTAQGGVVDAYFDFKAGTFWVKIYGTKLDTQAGTVAFNIAMGGFSEGVSVETGR